jgi:gamma-glutamyl hercynylcysteine S-oxide synthase
MSGGLEAVVRDLERSALDPASLASASAPELGSLLAAIEAFARVALTREGDGQSAAEILAIAAVHPSPQVRRALVTVVAELGAATDQQRELLCWAVGDSDDEVALRAIRACERHEIADALLPLADSLGRVPDRLDGNLAGLTDVRTYAAMRAAGRLRSDSHQADHVVRELLASAWGSDAESPEPDVAGMVGIPAGTVRLGLGPEASPTMWLPADNYASTARTMELEAFYIDARGVTNEEYDTFVEASRDADHAHCHPDEPAGTDHTRATLLDASARPDHPVTGVSWFDAYSYAAFYGKHLPSDAEWEYAAGGADGLAYPWGDEFDATACRWLATTVEEPIESLEAWEAALEALLGANDRPRTARYDKYPENVSPFGVHDMAGNAWEWTRSRYVDGADIQPRGWGPGDPRMRGDWTSIACVKGGSWAALPDMLLNAYRGRMGLQRRSPEVGFRCVVAAGA